MKYLIDLCLTLINRMIYVMWYFQIVGFALTTTITKGVMSNGMDLKGICI